MKAEGLAQNSDAHYFRENCVHTMEVGLIELITPEVWQCPNNHYTAGVSIFLSCCLVDGRLLRFYVPFEIPKH